MPSRKRNIEWLRHPERVLADLIGAHARGENLDRRHLWRAVVLAVDNDGGQLENVSGNGGLTVTGRDGRTRTFPARTGPDNPRGSVKARILTNGWDRLLDDEDVRVFWPMSPPDQVGMPVSPGEHVYVTFEDAIAGSMEHGMWLSRVAGHDSAGSFDGTESYTAPSTPRSAVDSFAPNDPQYQKDDATAGMAPTTSATKHFEDG